jgi:hypothetical protein
MARVILMQAGPRILPTFPESLSRQATAALAALGVEALTDSRVERIDEEGIVAAGRRVAARNAFWAAGVMASPATQWLKAEADRAGRVKVGEDLSVPGASGGFCDWRYCSVQRLERQGGTRPGARGQASGPLRRLGHQGSDRGPPDAGALPLPPCR